MAIGKRLELELKKRNMNVVEFSKKTNIPATTIYSIIKRDNKRLDCETAKKICSTLNISENVLLTGSEYFNPFFLISTMNKMHITEEDLIIETGCFHDVFNGVLPSKVIRNYICKYMNKSEPLLFPKGIDKYSLDKIQEMLYRKKNWNSKEEGNRLIEIYNTLEQCDQKKIIEYAEDIMKASRYSKNNY